jgi:hypothetical protein
MKTRPDALYNAENWSGCAKQANSTQRAWYRRERVWERKT